MALADGRDVSFAQLVQEWKQGKRNYCYTIQRDERVGVAPIINVRMTKADAQVIRVILENDAQIVCTPDHPFLLRDGSYRSAAELKTGDSLMPLRRQLSRLGRRITIKGYELVFDPKEHRWIFTHLLADRYNLERGRYAAADGPHRHHIDGNKLNNSPGNIRRMTKEEHLAHHSQLARETLRRPEVLAKLRNIRRSKEYREKIRKAMLQPAMRQLLSERAKNQWNDPVLLEWRSSKTRQQWTTDFRIRRKAAYDKTYLRKSLAVLHQIYRERGRLDQGDYNARRKHLRDKCILRLETICQRFFGGSREYLEQAAANFNHRVKKIETCRARMDVFDLEVPETHNFALSAGVFVHNSAKQGRDRRFQAILPLRGKIINVEKARIDKVLSNEEIRTIIMALGAGVENEFDLAKLRYHKLILMCDADVDGSHIRTLLLTFFYRQMRKLIEEGHVYIAQPPLYKVKKGKREEYVETDEKLDAMLIEMGAEGTTLRETQKKGSWTGKELREILEIVSSLAQMGKHLERKGISFSRYLAAVEPKKRGFPSYLVRTPEEKDGAFAYSDAERAKLTAESDKKKRKAAEAKTGPTAEGGDGREEEAEVIEIFESREIEKAAKRLEKFGIDLLNYQGATKEPIYELSYEKKKYPVRSLAEALDRMREISKEGMAIQRYKGLGEMNPEQLWETTMDPAKRTIRRVALEDAVEADEIFTVLMGDQVEPRREFIERFARAVRNLDV